MIKLTLEDGRSLYVVPSAIVAVIPRKDSEGTIIHFDGHPSPTYIKESATTVLRQLGWYFMGDENEKEEIKINAKN